jgi:uncharacterized protein (DUF885 family)
MRTRRAIAVLLILVAGCATTRKKAPTGAELLKAVADEYWQHQLDENPSLQEKFGLPTKSLPDASYIGAQREVSFAESLQRRLDRINVGGLSPEDALTYRILRWKLANESEALRFFWVLSPITPYGSQIHAVNRIFTAKKLEPAERARLLVDYGRYVDQLAEVVRQQQRYGFLLPKPQIVQVRAMLGSFVQPAETSMFRGGDDSRATRDAITNTVNPALQRLLAVLSPEYEAQAPAAVGLSNAPGGADAYRYLVKLHTTLNMTPEEIHQLGLREVERIGRELDQIRQRVAFQGSLTEFRQYLRTDPRFFAKSAEGIGERLTSYVRKIEPHMPRYFAKMPRATYDVKRLDPALEASMTFGYYQVPTATDAVGHYMYNGSKVNERNMLFAPALMLHELVPGHHYQISRQSENDQLPSFRRESWDTAYTEGWGEYSATLGREMGIYEDPYDQAGRLMMDSLLSVRLVVDTGMNALGWSRERAMQYMRENTFQSETEIATETLRYAADIHGQALAYKIGALKILEMREKAQRALGDRFDIKQFHEWIIANGSMPLAILEQHVESEMRRR